MYRTFRQEREKSSTKKQATTKKNKYIYQSYNKDYYNNNHYTMGIFPARVLCVCSRRVCGGEQELVKTFTAWQKLASLENTGSGAGGCSQEKITVVSGALYFGENNGLIK